jgi:MFS family permease
LNAVELIGEIEAFSRISSPQPNQKGHKLQKMENFSIKARSAGSPSTRAFLIWLSLAQLISWGTTLYLFGLSVAPIEQLLQVSRGSTSLAFGLAMLVEGLLAYPVGRLIDAGYGRSIMTGGSFLAAASLLAMSQVTHLIHFYVAWAVLGAAMSCILYTPIFSIVTRRFPLDYRRAIIIITFLGGLASTVFIPLMATLLSHFGWSTMVMSMAALNVMVCLPIHWFLLKGEPRDRVFLKAAATVRSSRSSALKQRQVMFLIGLFTTLGMAMASAMAAHLIPILRERGMLEFWVIWLPAAVGAIQVLGRMGILWSDGKLSVHRVNAMIVWLCPLGMLILMIAGTDLVMLLIFASVWGIANGCQTIVKGTAVAQYVSHENVAALNGSLGLPNALGRMLVPWGIGLMWSPSGGYGDALWVLLVLGICAALCFMLAQKLSLHGARQ